MFIPVDDLGYEDGGFSGQRDIWMNSPERAVRIDTNFFALSKCLSGGVSSFFCQRLLMVRRMRALVLGGMRVQTSLNSGRLSTGVV